MDGQGDRPFFDLSALGRNATGCVQDESGDRGVTLAGQLDTQTLRQLVDLGASAGQVVPLVELLK